MPLAAGEVFDTLDALQAAMPADAAGVLVTERAWSASGTVAPPDAWRSVTAQGMTVRVAARDTPGRAAAAD